MFLFLPNYKHTLLQTNIHTYIHIYFSFGHDDKVLLLLLLLCFLLLLLLLRFWANASRNFTTRKSTTNVDPFSYFTLSLLSVEGTPPNLAGLSCIRNFENLGNTNLDRRRKIKLIKFVLQNMFITSRSNVAAAAITTKSKVHTTYYYVGTCVHFNIYLYRSCYCLFWLVVVLARTTF